MSDLNGKLGELGDQVEQASGSLGLPLNSSPHDAGPPNPQCSHPDCLNWAGMSVCACYAPDDWEMLDVCAPHVGWGVERLVHIAREGVMPQIICAQLHDTL